MGKIRLDSVLAFVLIVPFIMTVRISPTETPFWLFSLIFIGFLVYILLDVLKIREKLYESMKNIGMWALVITVILSSFGSSIIVRHQTHPTYQAHDILVQQEIALRYLIDGKNPYAEDYFGTPLEQWHYSDTEVNPALYHFVMQPLYLVFALPFSVVSGSILGYFDGRFPLLFLFFVSLAVAFRLLKDGERRRSFVLLLAFNPLMIIYALEGRSDFFMFGFLISGLYFLHKKRLFLSAALIGASFAVKQSVWPLFPLYLAYLWFLNKDKGVFYKSLAIFSGIFLILVLPFFLWDPKAFLDSTIFYLSGNTSHSYPISGYGFGMLLNEFGIIQDLKGQFPFIVIQALVGIPLLLLLIKYLKKNHSVKNLVLTYGIFLFVYWYLSRYFNNSHIAFLSLIFTTAYFWPDKEQ
ncbi:MAG: hypothetical protein A2186_00640 [Candidatus Levybacteria bacterium RIFOXYA1_FULL_41_10]|nr:MAG: hypothetical protein US02_C0011G0013 [Candidatus Levybacteria bacterium GW2011_GWA2_36_13]KKQ00431.1 MAG: hypothetical protein US07_C0012G0004 [Candidatus Levybacteria bacterium GW2011_GWB1_36_18]KKR16099.1 MAG: hypothetical protein UT44_C0019G0005 [Candidatus Levybacteria bacterium GW2011_GWA1_39_32]KKR51136.1 MAG: hypothetical protein UT87_C0008G0014 [Candidatus Levybacteria bacterium GW2011_GWC1_40_19]KKR73436.1 MAG: hypothetical protein UU15_C0010G0006 [Candidatus Levybacteria bacte